MNRRAVFAALASAPVAAKAAVKAAAESVDIKGVSASVEGLEGLNIVSEQPSGEAFGIVETAFRRVQRRHEMRLNSQHYPQPVSIGTKKSWSPAFKVGMTLKEHTRFNPDIWGMSELERLRFMVDYVAKFGDD